MMKLEVGKQYKTHNGYRAFAVSEDDDGDFKVAIPDISRELIWYSPDGYACNSELSWFDEKKHRIVSEWKEPVKYPAWVNLYDSGVASAHRSKALADLGIKMNTGLIETRGIEWVKNDD